MKRKLTGIAFVVFTTVTLFSSFTKVSNGTGSVTVTATIGGVPMQGALVGIASSAENLENSNYIHEDETNAAGTIHFTNLAAGTYYLDADYSSEEESAYAEATVTVADGDVKVTIEME